MNEEDKWHAMVIMRVKDRQERGKTSYRAAAPEMISMSSLVMTAWRVRLKVRVSLSIISADEGKKKTKQKRMTTVTITLQQGVYMKLVKVV